MRKAILVALTDALNELVLDNGMILTAVNEMVDPSTVAADSFPIVSVLPRPSQEELCLTGTCGDTTFPIDISGFTLAAENEAILLTAEDVLEAIREVLTDPTAAWNYGQGNWSITSIGPVMADIFPVSVGPVAYISIPITTIFMRNE